TRDIWYWEQPLPEGRRKYSKTLPLQYGELKACREWWSNRQEGPQSWKVLGPDLIKRDEQGRVTAVDLDLKNPRSSDVIDHRAPEQILESAILKERVVLNALDELRALIAEK